MKTKREHRAKAEWHVGVVLEDGEPHARRDIVAELRRHKIDGITASQAITATIKYELAKALPCGCIQRWVD